MQNSQKLMPPLSGKCHCGKIEFELMCHLKDLKRCNCSHCRRKGFVMATVKLDEIHNHIEANLNARIMK